MTNMASTQSKEMQCAESAQTPPSLVSERVRNIISKCLELAGKLSGKVLKVLPMADKIIEHQRRRLELIFYEMRRFFPMCHACYCYDDQCSSVPPCW